MRILPTSIFFVTALFLTASLAQPQLDGKIAVLITYDSPPPPEDLRRPEEFVDPLILMLDTAGIRTIEKALRQEQEAEFSRRFAEHQHHLIFVRVFHTPGQGYQLIVAPLAHSPGENGDSTYEPVTGFHRIYSDDLFAGLQKLERDINEEIPIVIARLRSSGAKRLLLAECVLPLRLVDPSSETIELLADDPWLRQVNVFFFRKLRRSSLRAKHWIFDVPPKKIIRFCASPDVPRRNAFDVVISPTVVSEFDSSDEVDVLFDINTGNLNPSDGDVSLNKTLSPDAQAQSLINAIEQNPVWSTIDDPDAN